MALYHTEAPPLSASAAGFCRKRIDQVRDVLESDFGGQHLGCYGDRPKTGSTTQSSVHRDGRAADEGWLHDQTDAGREAAFKWLTENRVALGLQQVLMYRRKLSDGRTVGGKMWQLPSHSGDTRSEFRSFSKSGHWLHIEVHPNFADQPLASVPALPGAPAPVAPPVQPDVPERRVEITVTAHVIRRGSKGSQVKRAQSLLSGMFGQDIAIDGDFGSQTQTAVMGLQAYLQMDDVDGIIGPDTWGVLFNLPL